MEAFELAKQQGADGFELDVHLSADGVVVVTHDETLERVSNGTGFVNSHKLADLQKLSFSKLKPEIAPCKIPTLAEVYDMVAKTNMIINVELKTTMFLYPKLPAKLINLANEYKMQERVIYSSFNHQSLRDIKELDSRAEIGLLYMENLLDPWVYASHVNAVAIHPYYHVLKGYPCQVKPCHENKIKVNTWTVDDTADIDLMLKIGVDMLITNKPAEALARRALI